MAYEAIPNRPGVYRVVLEESPEDVYIFVFQRPDSPFPERDHLQDDLEMAMSACEEDFGIDRGVWCLIPTTGLR